MYKFLSGCVCAQYAFCRHNRTGSGPRPADFPGGRGCPRHALRPARCTLHYVVCTLRSARPAVCVSTAHPPAAISAHVPPFYFFFYFIIFSVVLICSPGVLYPLYTLIFYARPGLQHPLAAMCGACSCLPLAFLRCTLCLLASGRDSFIYLRVHWKRGVSLHALGIPLLCWDIILSLLFVSHLHTASRSCCYSSPSFIYARISTEFASTISYTSI